MLGSVNNKHIFPTSGEQDCTVLSDILQNAASAI